MLDLGCLCITAGSAVWLLRLDVVCLEYDGNLRDAVLLAAVAALANTRLPVPIVQPDGDVACHAVDTTALKLDVDASPLPLSFACVDDQLLADPCLEEETLGSSLLTVVVNKHGKVSWVCGARPAAHSDLACRGTLQRHGRPQRSDPMTVCAMLCMSDGMAMLHITVYS